MGGTLGGAGPGFTRSVGECVEGGGRCDGHGKAPKRFKKTTKPLQKSGLGPTNLNSTKTLRKLYETLVYQIIDLLYYIIAVMGVNLTTHIYIYIYILETIY